MFDPNIVPAPHTVDAVTPELKLQELARLKTCVQNLRRYRVPPPKIRGAVRVAINEVDNPVSPS